MSKWRHEVPVSLSMTSDQHVSLMQHLFPGDGLEAAAIALCGRYSGNSRHRLLVREIQPIPYQACTARRVNQVSWSTDSIALLLEKAEAEGLSVIKFHSHPTGYTAFSKTDDKGDRSLLPAIAGWVEAGVPHGSIIAMPSGQMIGRTLDPDGQFIPIVQIGVIGSDLMFWYSYTNQVDVPEYAASHEQAFGAGTFNQLQRLSIAVIGCSGTGSPVIEQLMRYGVGNLVIVDEDHAEYRNINRIINSTIDDAQKKRLKVDIAKEAINRAGLGTDVVTIEKNLWEPDAIRAVAECDIVFGCMDSVDGRFLLNLLATYYMIPYFDIGVRIDAVPSGAERGKIREVCGTVHYLQPGKSSLMSRGLFTMEQVASAGLKRNDPQAHRQQLSDGYISGVEEHRPAVISVNMFYSALAVLDFLARLHPYRDDPNETVASIEASLSSLEFFTEPEGQPCPILGGKAGKGDVTPLLDLVELAENNEK